MSNNNEAPAGDNLPTNRPLPETFTKKEGAIQGDRKSKRQKSKTDENQSTNTPNNETITEKKRSVPRTAPDTGPAEEWSDEELESLAAKAADRAARLLKDKDESLFALGQVAHENHEEVLNGAKRVPPNEDTFKRLSKKLRDTGVRKISHQRLRALEKAYLLRTEMGGPGKAPDLPPDHFIAVVNELLSMDTKREILDIAVEKDMSAPAVSKYVALKLGELGDKIERDETYWHDKLEKNISRAQSVLQESLMALQDLGIEIPPFTRERLNHLSVLIYQFANGQCDQRRVA